uniref:Uncharacterized protein n=1 Tax=Meloidogyne enterolobii TaxID=390850 RepID=A0A6V7V6H2_MELEN|nr:unnamed protein product [Meloidogyne enterolobii]
MLLTNEKESCEFFDKIMKLEVWLNNEIHITSLPIVGLNKIITINTNTSYKVEEYNYQKETEFLNPRRLIKFIVNKFENKTPTEMRIECRNKIKILEFDPKEDNDIYESCEAKVSVCSNDEYFLYYEIEGNEKKIELQCEEAFHEDNKINIYFIKIEVYPTCKLISSEELTSFSSKNLEKNKAKCIEDNKLKEDCENIQRFLEAPLDDGVLKISNYYTNLGQPSPNTPTSKVSLPTITNINSNPIESQAKTFYSASSQSNNLIHGQLNQHGNNWQQILQQNSLGDSSSCLGQIGQQCQPKPFPRIPSFQASSSRSHNNFSTDQNQQNIFHKQNSFQESSHTINNPIQGQLFGTSSSSQRIPSVQILSSGKTNSEPILHLQQINQQHLQQINQQHPQQHSINYPNQHQQLPLYLFLPPKIYFQLNNKLFTILQTIILEVIEHPIKTHLLINKFLREGAQQIYLQWEIIIMEVKRLPLESPTMTINQRNNLQLEHQIQNPLQNKRPQSISISSSTSNSKSTSTDGGDKNNKEMIERIVCDLQTTIQTIRHQINQNNELCKHLTELKEKSLHQKTLQEALMNQNVNLNQMAEHNTQSQHNLIGNVEEQHLQHFEDPLLFHNVGEHHNNNLFDNMEELQQSITSNVEEQHLPHQQNIEEIFGTSSEPSMLNFEEAAQQNITRKRNVNRKRKN